MQLFKKRLTRFSEIKLEALLEVTKAINNNSSVEEILAIFKDILQHKLKISKFIFYSYYKDTWVSMLRFGVAEHEVSIDVSQDFIGVNEITPLKELKHMKLGQYAGLLNVVLPVFHKKQALGYLLIGDTYNSKEVIRPSEKHLKFLTTFTSIIAVAIENKRLAKENLRQAALKRELELASIMQNMLVPESLPSNEKIDCAAYYSPHNEVGGDYYDFVQISDNECAFCVADVSGKGVAAALLMSNFQATVRVLSKYIASLPELIEELNTKVMKNAKGEKYVTFFIAKYNTDSRKLTYINAAHTPPVLVADQNVYTLDKGCTGLGMFKKIPGEIEVGEIIVPPRARIVCYTDGLTEIEDEAENEFGLERLSEHLKQSNLLNMSELNTSIIEKVSAFKGERPFVDDLAILSLQLF